MEQKARDLQERLRGFSNRQLWYSWNAALVWAERRGSFNDELHNVYLVEFKRRGLLTPKRTGPTSTA